MSALREIAAHFGVEFDDSNLKKGSSAIEGVMSQLGSLAGTLGIALGATAIYKFITGTTEAAAANLRLSESLGLSYVELKEWQYAANISGVEAESLQMSLTKLSGGKYDKKALAQLGVSAKDAAGNMKSSTDLLEDVGEALSKIDNPTKRNTLAMGVLGKSYLKLLPLLKGGAKGIEEMREEYHALGGGFSDEFAKNSEEFEQSQKKLGFIWKTLGSSLVAYILPTLLDFSKSLVALARVIVPILKNSKLFQVAMIGLGVKGFVFLSGKIGPLSSALGGLARMFFTVIAPLLILEDALTFLAGGDSLMGRAIEKAFGPGKADEVRKFFTDVNAGFGLATSGSSGFLGNLLGIGITMANVFKQGGIDGDNFYRVIDGVWRSIVLGASVAWEVLRKGWASIGASIQDVITAPVRAMQNMAVNSDIEDWKKGQREALKKARNDPNNPYKGTAEQTFDTPEQRAKDEAALNREGQKAYDRDHVKSAGEVNDAYSAQQAAKLVEEYDKLATQLDPRTHTPAAIAERDYRAGGLAGPPPPPGTVTVTNNVTVPPGTPKDQADAVAKAAEKGTKAAVDPKQAQAVLKPGGQ